jgi:hypothetical protein
MNDPVLGEGLVFEGVLPLDWQDAPLPDGAELARWNADGALLLAAEASLEEARSHEALKEESPALAHELQRLEFKLDILLRLAAELATHHSPLPTPQSVRLSSQGLEWTGADASHVGTTGIASVYVNRALPQPLRLPCRVVDERRVGERRIVRLRFVGLSDGVVEALDRLIFRHHRRLVAGARHASE